MNSSETQNTSHEMPEKEKTITLRIPKMNTQIVVLSLVAVVTLFQTFQLMRIGNKVASGSVKTSTSTAAPSAPSSGTGSAAAPAAMVGGC